MQQTKVGECGAACLAMVLGESLDYVLGLGDDIAKGINDNRMLEILRGHGHPSIISLEWLGGNWPAILTVPSLNRPGLLHFIVWDGEQFIDPSNGEKRYPGDSPVVNGVQLGPQWASLILFWPRVSGFVPAVSGGEEGRR